MWEKQVISLGYITPKAKYVFHYIYNGEKEIKKVSPLCQNCTKATFKKNRVDVTFIAESKPEHLKNQEVYVSKEVEVTFKDNSKEVLTFKGLMR